ncbi:MAG TPA: hypothetical protein VFR24_17500 [Candidatus Angelobacter sp.]|nr:hypothetical protein [Candidatus Angelobacter sp.]
MLRIRFTRSAGVSLLVFALSMSLLAEVKVELKASKIVVVNGTEQRQSADKAAPGAIIEYAAEYKNTAKASVSNVVATLPVPSGMEYLPDTAEPAQVMASTDDHNYSPVPLKRSVRGADGKMVEQLVPFSEYRSLRWKLGDIQGQSSKSVKARMKVKSGK